MLRLIGSLSRGRKRDGKPVRTPEEAQWPANPGVLVVAVYKTLYPSHHGHIAIVRPQVKTTEQIEKEGPQITQDGIENQANTSLKKGFEHHKNAWEKRRIRFYRHKVDWREVSTSFSHTPSS
jgi:hypothetical protein